METKLREEFEKIKDLIDETPVEYVMNHLILAGAENAALADRILNSNKTLKGCCKYIYSSVEKSVEGKSGRVCVCKSPEEVYALAEEYFMEETKDKPDLGDTVKKEKMAAPKKKAQGKQEESATEYEQISFF